MNDLRSATIASERHRLAQRTALIFTGCVVSIVGAIMLFSWMFAGPYHPPDHYRPTCRGSGVHQVITESWNNYLIVCNDGFSYENG